LYQLDAKRRKFAPLAAINDAPGADTSTRRRATFWLNDTEFATACTNAATDTRPPKGTNTDNQPGNEATRRHLFPGPGPKPRP
jgi:hypothetical protein